MMMGGGPAYEGVAGFHMEEVGKGGEICALDGCASVTASYHPSYGHGRGHRAPLCQECQGRTSCIDATA